MTVFEKECQKNNCDVLDAVTMRELNDNILKCLLFVASNNVEINLEIKNILVKTFKIIIPSAELLNMNTFLDEEIENLNRMGGDNYLKNLLRKLDAYHLSLVFIENLKREKLLVRQHIIL